MRGPAKHFTASKVLCWVAADRGAKLALLRGDAGHAADWRKAADEMHADICANGTDDRGVFCQHYGTTALDASALLIPLLGFLPPDDPRVRATVLAIADELTEDELVLRYRVEETDDGFSGEEGSFTICSFWLVSALTEIGEVDRARALCEKLLSYASPLSLYAEEIDAHSGRQLGNFPQAFSHLALINAVMHLIREDERRGGAAMQAGLDLHAGSAGRLGSDDEVPAVTPDVSVLVVGGGPAGFTAALQACELGARVTLLEEGPGRRDQPEFRAGAGADAGAGGPAGAGLVVLGPVRPDRRGARPRPTRRARQQRAGGPLRPREEGRGGPHPPARHRPGRASRSRRIHRAAHDGRRRRTDLDARTGSSSPSAGMRPGCRSPAPTWRSPTRTSIR